jgi:peptidoglycan/xylan/chitin deacetylase (PgdA/CDA1 family)
MPTPALVVSLDFELYWGVRDVVSLDQYRDNLLGVREAIPALLNAFRHRGIHATWATVGFLFCSSKREIEETMPCRLPLYENPALSPYDLSDLGEDEAHDPFHYAPTLIGQIAATEGQELGSHTFSHFYCEERGQTALDFEADLESAARAASRFGVTLKSLVFPRNEVNRSYRDVLEKRGIKAYRGNGPRWPYTAPTSEESLGKRAVRLADAYVPLAGRRTYGPGLVDSFGLVDVPASAFLRSYSRRLKHLDGLKLRRLREAMSHAAAMGEIFHLWWHPHNFGVCLRENMEMLGRVLDHFEVLRKAHGMESLSMFEASTMLS